MLRQNVLKATVLLAVGIGMNMAYEQKAAGCQDQTPPKAEEGRNRLGETTSPYLLQHAKNPVHWWPWGEAAFDAAVEQNKPIFMSIGYSTCYWCHVMERESFEDEEVAAYLNEHFISIKVDREERPDVDEIYMMATQLMNQGQGGWPMSVFLEPTELKPFYAGTYFPKEDRGTRRGFLSVLRFMSENFNNNREAVDKHATAVANAVVNRLTTAPEAANINSKTVQEGIAALLAGEDKTHGGFATSPKFPMPIYSDFLMETGWNIPQVRKAVTRVLDAMLQGGMYDQVGGGFHRYSTDEKWLVPHFEKMLYDNGQLLSTYANAYELTEDETYANVLRETVAYVERELSSPDGGFLSAQDAETNHLEGETYLWRENELREALTTAGQESEIAFALSVYGVDQGTNFQDPHHLEVPPTNVLYLVDHPEKIAKTHGLTREEFEEKLATVNHALLSFRETRDQPSTDDKVITAWNGLMIGGLADAGRVLGEQQWIDRAKAGVDFIQNEMRTHDGRLLRTWRNGTKGNAGFLEDYASMIRGLLSLYVASGDASVLDFAKLLYATAKSRFYVDGEGWYDTEENQSDLFVRTRAFADGAVPAATSMILDALVTLAELTSEQHYLDDAIEAVTYESGFMKESPVAAVVAMGAFHRLLEAHPELFHEEFEVSLANPSPVRMSCSESKLQLRVGDSKTIHLRLNLAKGWHINAHEPGSEYAVPLALSVLGSGVSISVAWPEPERITSAGESVSVYGGVVEIPITITATSSIASKLMITWQACTEESCLASETHEVPCNISVSQK
ncbi:MAG: DUF255 domain-containing protein [Phycisphaerales bacterium]|jgi:hypothetical protein|nr:DUF255 domain-containing protein [Phycisphaerales bacterium]